MFSMILLGGGVGRGEESANDRVAGLDGRMRATFMDSR